MIIKSDHKLLKSIFSYTTAVVFAQALMAVYTLLLIWWLDTETYGYITANYAAVTFTSFIISLGLHDWLIRSIPLHGDPKSLTGSILAYKFLIGIFWAAGLILLLPIIRPSIYSDELIIFIIIDIWAESSFYLLLADLLGHEKVMPTSFLLVLSRVLRLASLILVILLGSKSAFQIVKFRMAATCVVFLIAFIISRPKFRSIKIVNVIEVIKSSYIFNASEIQNLIFLQLDLNLLTIITGDKVLIGSFAIVISIINMMMTLPLGVASLILPNSIKSFKKSPKMFINKMKSRLIIFIILGIILSASVFIFKINFINNKLINYQNAIRILILASPLLLIRTLNQFNRVYLLSVGWEKKQLLPQAIGIISKLVFGIFFIINFGVKGLIWISIFSDILILFGFTYQTIRHSFFEMKLQIR